MLGKFLECEANKNDKYYRVIQTIKEYSDGKRFPIDEEVVADKGVNFNAIEQNEMGGFCITTYDYVFRCLLEEIHCAKLKFQKIVKFIKPQVIMEYTYLKK